MTNKPPKILMIALSFGAFLLSNSSCADEPARTFTEGIYRQNGTCTKLTRFLKDETPKCSNFLGVLARKDDIPEFMFPLSSGVSRVFVSSKTAVFSQGNRVISYAIARVVDLEAGIEYPVFGQCVLTIRLGQEEIDCTTWKDKEQTTPMFEAHFVGDGMWIHKPSFSKKP